MIKKTISYITIIIIAFSIGYISSITFKNLLNVYYKVKYNNKQVNFLKNTNSSKNIPSLCFQSAYRLAVETKTPLPEIFPLGALPIKNKNNLIELDRYGFRNNDRVWDKTKHDFLILGDSVVADDFISDKDIFSNNFKNKNVINLGCGGNGLLTSLHLIEQITQTNHSFNNILFFLNLDNDFSKDTLREYNTELFLQTSKLKSKNIFLNKNNYKIDYLNFVKDAFIKETFRFSLKKELYNQLNLEIYFKEFSNLIKTNKESELLLEDGSIIDSSLIPEGFYNTKMYNIFLSILERITVLKQKNSINITFILVPTNNELNVYNSDRENKKQWEKYLYYRYFKNTIISTISNYNINILDLSYFIKDNNYKGFKNGHFEEYYHKLLSIYINDNISNQTDKLLSKLYYYNSFFPAKEYFNYQVNFGSKLNKMQIDEWLNIVNDLIEKNLIDNYLLTPSLGYFFINHDCDSILNLYKLSNGKLIKFSVGNFFYKTCNLQNSENLNKTINEINFLIDKDVKYYIPTITNEVKKSLKRINEN
jgi:hypothetical protein